MDEQRSRPQEEESSYLAPTATKPEALSGWLQRGQAEVQWHQEDDEDEDEKGDSSTESIAGGFAARWRRLFRRASERLDNMFWPVAEVHMSALQTNANTIIGNGHSSSNIDDIKLDYEDMYRMPELPTNGHVEAQQIPYVEPERPIQSDMGLPELATQLPDQSTQIVEATPPPEAPPLSLPFVAEVQRTPEATVVEPTPQPERPIPQSDQRWLSGASAAPIVVERTVLQPQESPAAQFNRQVQELKLQAAQNMESQQKLERIIAQERQAPKIEPIATPRPVFEQQYQPVETQYSAPAQAERQAFAPNVVPDTDSLAEQHVKPQVVMESVAVAAEQNTAVERVYERRQEVRDEPAAKPATNTITGAPSVATILAAQQAQQANFERLPVTPAQPQQAPITSDYASSARSVSPYEQDIYRQATRVGFWVAVMVIIGAAVFYFVR